MDVKRCPKCGAKEALEFDEYQDGQHTTWKCRACNYGKFPKIDLGTALKNIERTKTKKFLQRGSNERGRKKT